jgi:type IV pilus assembly protein PilA
MVVLLIIAILLAIAIPTFLGARNTANARSTQENLRNALTAEQTNWTNNQAFSNNLATIEPSLVWDAAGSETTTGNHVVATPADANNQVTIVGLAKDGNCYAIEQSNDPAVAPGSFTGYAEWKPAAANTCTAAAVPTIANPATGSAGTTNGAWETSF